MAIVCGTLFSACGPDDRILKSGKETPAQANVESLRPSFAKDLEEVNIAKFTFVYVLRRKDGQKLDAEDRGIIRLQTVDMNRRVVSDEDKAVIIGSNYQLPASNMLVLLERFAVETYATSPANINSASNNNK